MEEKKCIRCGMEFDHHGSFETDYHKRICWWCFKKEELKDEEFTESED